MTDVVFINLEQNDERFRECVDYEKSKIRHYRNMLPAADRPSIKFFDVTDSRDIYNAAVSATRVLHIAGHGKKTGHIQSHTKRNKEQEFAVSRLTDYLVSQDYFLDVDCIILDSCFSARHAWKEAISGIVGPKREIAVIGSVFSLYYSEAKDYFDVFYSVLLRSKLPVRSGDLRNRVERAHREARSSFIARNWRPSMVTLKRVRDI